MEKVDMKRKPSHEYRYWLYDSEGDGMTYYRSKEIRDSQARKAICSYLEEAWATEVECVSAGEVTHFAQMLDRIPRPSDEELEKGSNEDGMSWPDGMNWRGDYQLEPLVPKQAGGKIVLPVCNSCQKPLFGRRCAEERCWCDTVGNWGYKEMEKEEEVSA